MTATSFGTAIPGIAIDSDKMRRATGPLIALAFVGILVSAIPSGDAKADGCDATPTQIADMLDEMARLQGADRLG